MIDLSVIIPVYNASALINRCLDSIFQQTTQYSYEIILVDDGSKDDSIELVKARKEKNIILYQQENFGPSAARNKGVELASGRYCAYLDADDYWLDGFIQKTVSFLDENPDCIAVNVAQRHLTVSGENKAPSCYQDYNKPFRLENFFLFWAQYNHVCTGSITISTPILKQTGGQRPELRVTEDLEFWALIATYGGWGFIPQILFVSDGRNATISQGWIHKMKIRWKNAPSIEDWEKRIKNRFPNDVPFEYVKARGHISRVLTYCQLLSGRLHLSRTEAMKYGENFGKDKISILMNAAKHTSITWWILAKLLQYREYHRKL